MSKAEVERFVALLDAWSRDEATGSAALLVFLRTYREPLSNALRFYAADK